MTKLELENLAVNMQHGIRSARERGEDTTPLEKEFDHIIDKLLALYPVTVIGTVGCNSKGILL